MSQNHTLSMTMKRRSRTSYLLNGTRNTIKRRSLAADGDHEKKKAKKETTSHQGQSCEIFSCGICFDSVKFTDVFFGSYFCNHTYCIDCISEYFTLLRKERAVKLICPGTKCSFELKPEHFLSILPKDLIVEWESAIYESSKKTSERFTCGICLDSVKESKMFANPLCNHPFCIKCIRKYVKLQRKENVVKFNCPDPECSLELKPELFQSILPKDLIVDWESAIYESSVSLEQKIYCPFKDCSLMMVNEGEEVVTSCECPSCHRLFCAQCKVPWHADMSCRRFQKSPKDPDDEELDEKFLELAKRKKWQICPECSMHVQRRSGCEHISCRCGCNFCYECGKRWKHSHVCNRRTRLTRYRS